MITKNWKITVKDFPRNGKSQKKDVVLAEDFNIKLLGFDANKKIQNFVNVMFRFGKIPLINKSTRITRHTASAISHIISIMHTGFKSGIIKTDISDHHFPIFFCYKYIAKKEHAKKEFIYKL